ncbi:hypothetical protein [Aridibaculum aurantiacum]|uniref:hypothetical protein n=1 Tax=Aridibaculum aurantiacum TaxID=2810307 RepID=UPI001A97B0D6|nr:hypothetical protein [Aridibaculum aurantiacum]
MIPYKTICIFILCTGLFACQKSIEPLEEIKALPEFVEYLIPAGQQYATTNPFTQVEYTEMKFIVRFDSSAIYQTADTSNQWDVNKLYGFADNNGHHSNFSARFGWRWKDNELHLFSYIYNNGVRSDNDIGRIEIGKEHHCSIRVASGQYIFTLNGNSSSWPRASTTPTAQGYKLYPFFGGDEVAPHDIRIWIKEL